MNKITRRNFMQSLVAAISIPAGLGSALKPVAALSAAPAGTALAAAAVPKKVQFWAIYMSGLHGECSPATLHQMLQIPEEDARRYLTNMVADGLIKPNPLLRKTISSVVQQKEGNLSKSLKSRFKKKELAQADVTEPNLHEPDVIELDANDAAQSPVGNEEDTPEVAVVRSLGGNHEIDDVRD